MSYLVGQQITKFWAGEKYIFRRNEHGHWECVYQDSPIIPHQIIEELRKSDV
jgi:hypothetical protein